MTELEKITQKLAQSGHGHVVPRTDGARMRCSGQIGCVVCQADLARYVAAGGVVTPVSPPLLVKNKVESIQNLVDFACICGKQASVGKEALTGRIAIAHVMPQCQFFMDCDDPAEYLATCRKALEN